MAAPIESRPLHVAIVGGGLCGLALAIALTNRSISYTIYEARESSSEIGAGINLAPNSLQAFNLIDPSLGDLIFQIAARNPPGLEDVWVSIRLGAETEKYADSKHVMDLMAPPTGNTTVSRNELLQEMARKIPAENAKFNKKITGFTQSEEEATMTFEDGSMETATLVIACDGAHSAMRRFLLGPNNSAASAHYSDMGGYRAVFPMAKHEEAIGKELAHCSQLWCGPSGYIIMYPIDRAQNVNIGVWPWKKGEWPHEAWVLHHQKAQMLKDFQAWGPATQKLIHMMSDGTQFWATHHHSVQPDSYFNGKVIMIGDAAHSMGPHQGQGAAQSMEDSYVMAQVLRDLNTTTDASDRQNHIRAALTGYETVRRARYERCLQTSYEAMSFWADFWRPDLNDGDFEQFRKDAELRMQWMWDARLEEQGEQARAIARDMLAAGPAASDAK